MAKNIFTSRFCEIVKKQVCTTSAELNFDEFTTPGTYEIYEDMGSGQNRVYFLTVDKSASGKCLSQTRTHCGKVEYRHYTTAGKWAEWAEVSGGAGIENKEDKSNKSAYFDITESFYPDDERYPNFFALWEALLQGNDVVRGEFVQGLEEQKGRIITGKGEPKEASEEKLGLLYLDEDSYFSFPTVYVCTRIENNNFAWVPVDLSGINAYDIATGNVYDIYDRNGHIAKTYQDKSEKTTTISSESTDEQYPSAKATFDGIQAKTSWEFLKSDTLTSAVTVLSNTFEHQYKELYVHLIIPTMKSDEVTEVPNGRVAVYAGKRYNNTIFMESTPSYADNGVSFPLTFKIEMLGKYCRVQRYYKSNTTVTYYAGTAVVTTGYADIGQTYLDMLTLEFMPTTRKFPSGTYYEIWGVRA